MNRTSLLLIAVLVAASLSFGPVPTFAQIQAAAQNAIGHGAFPAKLIKTWDSSKLKEGEGVEAETTGSFKLPDGTLVPKGSKLTGHVIMAKAHSKGDLQSELIVVFDKLKIVNGQQLSIKGTVQAVFPPPDEPDPGMPANSSVQKGNGGATMPTPGYQPTTDIKIGSAGGNTAKSEAASDPKSIGVQGISGIELGAEGALLSTGKQVKLGSGVRMIVHVDIFGS
jgi:hypothetical protein